MRSDQHQPHTRPSLHVPNGWRQKHNPRPGILMELGPTSRPRSGLTPVVTLTVGETALGPREHLDQLATLVRTTFDRVDVEARDCYDYQGVDVGYLRFFHRTPRHDVIVEMWNWIIDGRVWSMVASADHRDHPDYTDLFDDLAATFDPGTPGGGALAS